MVPAAAVPVIVEEHEVVHEAIATGPGGFQAMAVDIEDDVIVAGAGAAIVGAAAGCGGGGPPPCEPGSAGALPPPPGHPHNC